MDEHGEPERAELIRLQIEHLTARWCAKVPANKCRCRSCKMSRRTIALLEANAVRWEGEVLKFVRVAWERGFPAGIALPCADFLRDAEAIFRAHPVQHCRLTDRQPQDYHNNSGPRIYGWWRADGPLDRAHDIPIELWELVAKAPGVELFGRWADFRTREGATSAMDAATVSLGRNLAGLPPLAAARESART